MPWFRNFQKKTTHFLSPISVALRLQRQRQTRAAPRWVHYRSPYLCVFITKNEKKSIRKEHPFFWPKNHEHLGNAPFWGFLRSPRENGKKCNFSPCLRGALQNFQSASLQSLKIFFFSRKKFWGRKIFFQKKLPNGFFCWGPDVFMG